MGLQTLSVSLHPDVFSKRRKAYPRDRETRDEMHPAELGLHAVHLDHLNGNLANRVKQPLLIFNDNK